MASFFEGAGEAVVRWFSTSASWVLIISFIVAFFIGILLIRKYIIKMNKVVFLYIDLGNGRFDKIKTRGGWFKEKSTFFGLIDYKGENIFKIRDGRIINDVSLNDFRYYNQKKLSLDVYVKPDDSKMLFPISKFFIDEKTRTSLVQIAPADYRSAVTRAIEEAIEESKSKWAQYAPVIVLSGIILISLIITILNTQYGKYMIDKATETLLQIKSMSCGNAPNAP